MSGGTNWSRANQIKRMQRQGSEPAKEEPLPVRFPRPKVRPMSKEELRREADMLIAAAGGITAVKARAPSPPLKKTSVSITRSREDAGATTAPVRSTKRGCRAPKGSGGTARYADVAVPPGLVIYADGACEPNPGAGGWAYVVYRDGEEIHSECGGDDDATNNTMEMTAALKALRWITLNVASQPVRLLTDSMYVVNGCNDWRHGWKRKGWKRGPDKPLANLDLWRALDAALIAFPIKLEWVKGHAGTVGNERADELAGQGREESIPVNATPLDLIRQQLTYSV